MLPFQRSFDHRSVSVHKNVPAISLKLLVNQRKRDLEIAQEIVERSPHLPKLDIVTANDRS